MATCQTDSNHTFVEFMDENRVVQGQNVTFSCLYEIEKSQDITVNWLKDSFYYTTVFDFDHPKTLPFEYEIPPEVKDYVEYVLEGDVSVPINNMLNVGEYNVSLRVNTKNYYYNESFKFSVTDLPAEVVVPVNSSYVYTGSVINSFLTSIGVTLKDKDGKALNTIYWTKDSTEFTFMFKKVNEDNTTEDLTDKIDLAPSEVGNYLLEINYESKEHNYSGFGKYYYSIIRKSYTGSIGFIDATIYYDPSLSPQEFYDLIIGRMFTIGEEAGVYHLELRSETDGNVEIKRDDADFEDYKLYLFVPIIDDIAVIGLKDKYMSVATYSFENGKLQAFDDGEVIIYSTKKLTVDGNPVEVFRANLYNIHVKKDREYDVQVCND